MVSLVHLHSILLTSVECLKVSEGDYVIKPTNARESKGMQRLELVSSFIFQFIRIDEEFVEPVKASYRRKQQIFPLFHSKTHPLYRK